MLTRRAADGTGMAHSPVGSAADEADSVTETIRRREVLVPQQLARHPDDDALLAAVRAGLTPGDPVARLLALWPAPPSQPVVTHTARS